MDEQPITIGPQAHLTLHYRVALADGGAEVISTFGGRPATLQLGCGQLAEALEQRLIGLNEGDERHFDLAEGEAFGQRHPGLLQSFTREFFDAHAHEETEAGYVPGDIVRIRGDGGEQVAGVIKTIDAQRVVMDFNHPLAGRAIVFDVRVLGVLPG
ncbi:MAG: FKBP-type peptidyl-prolyl cis-trans isomerase [Burkholderiaceae bacterium]